MKIIKNNYKATLLDDSSKRHTCRWCKSILEYQLSDVTIGNIVYSQREEDSNIKGLICAACNRFDNLNNGYK